VAWAKVLKAVAAARTEARIREFLEFMRWFDGGCWMVGLFF
jgi:hypothetical protein